MTFVARKSGQFKFKISEIVEWVDGKPKTKSVPKKAWHSLGINSEMSLDEARKRVSELNAERKLEKRKITSIVRRLEDVALIKSVYLPEDLVVQFLHWLEENKIKGDKKRQKLYSHWEIAQKLIAEAQVFPQDFFLNAGKLLNFFVKKQYSMSYARKVIALLNYWGTFYSSKRGTPYYPLRHLDKGVVGEIERTYADSDRFVGPSEALTPRALESVKNKLKPEQYKYLYCTVWLGLRPSEIDARNTPKKRFEVYYDEESECDVLRIYQPKLKNKPDLAWKYIPLFLPEQKVAAQYLAEELKAPIPKTLQNLFTGRVTLYGGRQGFVGLMVNKYGQDLNQVSNWMGHTNIYRTKRSYEKRKAVKFNKIAS